MTTRQGVTQSTVLSSKEQDRENEIRRRRTLIKRLEKKIELIVRENREHMNQGFFKRYQRNCLKIKHMREEIYNNRVMVGTLAENDFQPE